MKRSTAALFLGALFILIGCGPESTKLVPKRDMSKEEYTEKPSNFQAFNPRVDILFVIDNSGSMQSIQESLSKNALLFADAISKSTILDFHIGVVTTDMDDLDQRGQLVGMPVYLEKTTPDLVTKLSNRMIVGTGGSPSETMFAPVLAALSPLLEGTVNAGFYRQNAYLAVMFITDAADQSKYSPKDLLDYLIKKKIDPNLVLGYGVIRKVAEAKTCGEKSGESVDRKLEDFLEAVVNGGSLQKNILSLCDRNFGPRLAEFAKDIVRRSASTIKLNRIPNLKTVKVMYGVQEIPNDPVKGWTYQPSTNSIILAEEIEWVDQGRGVGLTIDFEVIEEVE